MEFSILLDNCLALFSDVYTSFSALFEWFIAPLDHHIEWLNSVADGYPFIDALLGYISIPLQFFDAFADSIGVPYVSLAVLMLGGGCLLYLLFQFVTWLLNLVT